MRSGFLLSLVSILSCVFAASTPTSSSTPPSSKSFNPPSAALLTHIQRTPQKREAKYVTNAERLRRGMPLNPPKRRSTKDARGHHPHHPKPSGWPGIPGIPSQSEIQSGFIEVYDTSSGDLAGFVSRSFNDLGEYTVTSDLGNALSIQIDTGSRDLTSIVTTNGPDINYPFFGAITGYGNDQDGAPDLGSGKSNYVYLGGVIQTSQHSQPTYTGNSNSFTSATTIAEGVESAIWSYDSDGTLTAHWTNSDSSTPQLFAGIFQGALMYTGDPDAFGSDFGDPQLVKFKFVPTS